MHLGNLETCVPWPAFVGEALGSTSTLHNREKRSSSPATTKVQLLIGSAYLRLASLHFQRLLFCSDRGPIDHHSHPSQPLLPRKEDCVPILQSSFDILPSPTPDTTRVEPYHLPPLLDHGTVEGLHQPTVVTAWMCTVHTKSWNWSLYIFGDYIAGRPAAIVNLVTQSTHFQ